MSVGPGWDVKDSGVVAGPGGLFVHHAVPSVGGGGRKRKGGMQVRACRACGIPQCLTDPAARAPQPPFLFLALRGEEHPCTLPLPLPSISHGKTQG